MPIHNHILYKFDLSSLAERAKAFVGKHINGATISLPFVSFSVVPEDIEKKVAREILIRLRDKRVLISSQCCHSCTDLALKSLCEVRSILIDNQVQLAEFTDGALFLLIDYMLLGIRDFLTYEEKLRDMSRSLSSKASTFELSFLKHREEYLTALEQLRAHLFPCLQQISIIADLPKGHNDMPFSNMRQWQLSMYKEIK